MRSASYVCDEIVILDDCSTDRTVEICKKFPKVVEIYERKEPLPLDEVRDKRILWDLALKRNPDYLLNLDGDEVLAPNSKQILFNELTKYCPNEIVFSFQFLWVWEKPNLYRVDGSYGNTWQIRLIKINDETRKLNFASSGYPRNAHSEHTPKTKYVPVRSDVKILHYANYDKKLRNERYNYFNQVDPKNSEFLNYNNIISGDLNPEIIHLKEIPKGEYVEDIS